SMLKPSVPDSHYPMLGAREVFMHASHRWSVWAGAICIVLGFGALFVGKVIMYPTALIPGSLLDRLRAEPAAWEWSHRIMTVGFVLLLPACVSLWGALRSKSPILSWLGALLLGLGAAMSIGQFALDFAYLVAAQNLPPDAGQAFVDAMLAHPFAHAAFYEVPNLSGIGVLLLAIAMLRQGRAWWLAGAVVALTIASSLVEKQFGPIGSRITVGVQFLGFTLAAWRMARAAPVTSPALAPASYPAST
ncbi:MAG TPA: hypothetical protein DEB06_11000, partial [Phycisphaerales bacterium]|nr:hypothetical protein [Phycisphaerales bacterium]